MARMRRIPSDKDRQRKAKKRGGFDDSWIDEDTIKSIEKTYKVCYWCKQPMKAITDGVHKKGYIVMSCETDECPGNQDTTKPQPLPFMKNKFARYVDGDTCLDFSQLLSGRDPNRLLATKKLTIDPL